MTGSRPKPDHTRTKPQVNSPRSCRSGRRARRTRRPRHEHERGAAGRLVTPHEKRPPRRRSSRGWGGPPRAWPRRARRGRGPRRHSGWRGRSCGHVAVVLAAAQAWASVARTYSSRNSLGFFQFLRRCLSRETRTASPCCDDLHGHPGAIFTFARASSMSTSSPTRPALVITRSPFFSDSRAERSFF